MRRIRSRLTYANVMVTILAFLVLGGGTAVAAIVVSDNSQVAANTISGHKPPTGKHANIIGGSVNGTDLATGAVTSGKIGTAAVTMGKLAGNSVNDTKIVNGSVTGLDLNKADVLHALDIRSGSLTLNPGGADVIYGEGEFVLFGQCVDTMGGTGVARITMSGEVSHKKVLTVGESSGEVFTGTSSALAETPSSSTTNGDGANFSVLSLNGAGEYLEGRVQATFVGADDSPSMQPQCRFTFTGVV